MLNDPEGAGAPPPESPEAARWRKALIANLENIQPLIEFCERLARRLVESQTWICSRDKDGKFEPTVADLAIEIGLCAVVDKTTRGSIECVLSAEDIALFAKERDAAPTEAAKVEIAKKWATKAVRDLYAMPAWKIDDVPDEDIYKAIKASLFGFKKGGVH